MKDGFIKCGAASIEVAVGDCKKNADSIVKAMKDAHKIGVKLLALPELCVCGYTCGDLFLQDALLDSVEDAVGYIVKSSKSIDVVTVIGVEIYGQVV